MLFRRFWRTPDTLRPQPQEMVSDDEEVGQGASDEQAMGVLFEAAVADLGESEHPLDDATRLASCAGFSNRPEVIAPRLGLPSAVLLQQLFDDGFL